MACVSVEDSTSGFSDEQRLAFGRAAELYDDIRPGYPEALIDGLMAAAGLVDGDRVYEVGAGTGKGTVELAGRGLEVLAIEPDPEMARIARRHLASLPRVSLIETGFEQWACAEPRKTLISFQAWHWMSPELRYRIAHDVICPDGTLGAVWSFPDWQHCLLREQLAEAYRTAAPGMSIDFPMHPASAPTALAGDWKAESVHEGLFRDPVIRQFTWVKRYRDADYVRLLQTHQDHILLGADQRDQLLAQLHDVIHAAGEAIDLPLTSYLCTATRSGYG